MVAVWPFWRQRCAKVWVLFLQYPIKKPQINRVMHVQSRPQISRIVVIKLFFTEFTKKVFGLDVLRSLPNTAIVNILLQSLAVAAALCMC